MGLNVAVIAGGVFEAEQSLAAANDVMTALKEAEHEPTLFEAAGDLTDTLLRARRRRRIGRHPRRSCSGQRAVRGQQRRGVSSRLQ